MEKLYSIRDREGRSGPPLSLDEIKKRIKQGLIHETDEISVYPNQFALEAKSYPEFEELFSSKTKTKTRNPFSDDEVTEVNALKPRGPDDIKTRVTAIKQSSDVGRLNPEREIREEPQETEFPNEVTRALERPKVLLSKDERDREKTKSRKSWFPKKSFLILMVLALVVYEEFYEDEEATQLNPVAAMVPVRPRLPTGGANQANPELSEKIYAQGIAPYVEDTVRGYRVATETFHKALGVDPQNVKALAMLASSYMNLIESSNKDENSFSVINKLIDLSKSKQLDLVETLIAEVEFLASANRYDSGIQRLVEFAKVSGKFDPILYYYMGWLYAQKGEYASAMKYLNLIPASALKIPKLYYLRGYIHEQVGELNEAEAEYRRAIQVVSNHTKSILGLVRIEEKRGELKRVEKEVRFLVGHPSFQNPKEYVQALVYQAKLALLFNRTELAVQSYDRAIKIDNKNEALKLDYFALLADKGKNTKYQKLAQMYALVLDGDRNLKAGKIHEAMTSFLQARDAFPRSTLPLIKLGDYFFGAAEYNRAIQNFKKALEIDPKEEGIVIRLIDSMIKNHDWEDAEKLLGKYRSQPKIKSSIDRLAGDLSRARGNPGAALTLYRKAMSRDTIDTDVYSAYADVLREFDQCKDAQFFYSLASKLDPENYQAVIGAAKCLLKTDKVDVAVSRIQEELIKLPKARPDLLSGIAEIYRLARDDQSALKYTAQAKEIDPTFAEAYRIEGEIYAEQMISKKELKKQMLESFKNYSDYNRADPTGYIKRFQIFMQDSQFEQAALELDKVFDVSPRFPELHYRRAQMYLKMGRVNDALNELEAELSLNGRSVKALVEQGNIFTRLGRLDEAMKSLTTAMSIDPKSASAKLGAGFVNYQKKQFGSAIALYQAALSLDKGNPEIYKKLGHAYRDSGELLKSKQAFQSYLDLAPDAPDRSEYEAYLR